MLCTNIHMLARLKNLQQPKWKWIPNVALTLTHKSQELKDITKENSIHATIENPTYIVKKKT